MGEAKRRKKQDASFGRSTMIGGIRIRNPKYLNPKFYDSRLETFSPVTRTLGTTKEELIEENNFEKLDEVALLDSSKVTELVMNKKLNTSANLETYLRALEPAINPQVREIVKKSPTMGAIWFIMLLSNSTMPIEMLEQADALILKNTSTACSSASTADDADVVRYVRGTIKGGQSYLKTFTTMRLIDCLDVIENIGKSRVIYQDSHIAVTWNRDDLGSPGELNIAIIDPDGLWSYDKWTSHTVPMSSLKGARQAIADYRSSNSISRRGEITHKYSERLSRFLGLHVQDGYAYLNYQEALP